MTKIIERVVKSPGVPNENDLWLKKKADGSLSLNVHDNGEWKEIAGGGGGSAAGAVSYNEQELTEEQQMQARKNQDLYYSELIPGQTISWDGTITDRDWFEFKSNGGGGGGVAL